MLHTRTHRARKKRISHQTLSPTRQTFILKRSRYYGKRGEIINRENVLVFVFVFARRRPASVGFYEIEKFQPGHNHNYNQRMSEKSERRG